MPQAHRGPGGSGPPKTSPFVLIISCSSISLKGPSNEPAMSLVGKLKLQALGTMKLRAELWEP